MKSDQKQKLAEEYIQKEQLYSEFAALIRNLLEGFLRGKKFKFQIFHRSKDKEKLVEKIERKALAGKEYKALDDMEDLAGVRVVFYLESDMKEFLQLFSQEFSNCIVDAEEKYDPQGYRGKHFIFRLNNERVALVEYRKYSALKCEIQVSTILFHAWSEVEHDIIYKSTGDRGLLQVLGLDDLKQSFEKVMVEHLQAATYQLDYLNKKYTGITKAGKIFSSDFLTDITTSKNNDDIYEMLEIIEEFYYRKPDETLAIVNTIIGKKPLDSVLLHNFGGHKIYGKTHKNLVMKSLELLSNIRYFKPDEVLQLIATLSLNSDKNIANKALEIARSAARYDYNYMTQAKNYGPQKKALDFVLGWSRATQLKHIDFVETVLRQILNPSIEGTTSGLNEETQHTITFHSGVVSPTDFLKKMRREAIDLTHELYKATNDAKLKLKLVGVFDEASRTPGNVLYRDNVAQMIVDDLKYIAGIYREIVFGDGGNQMTNLLGVVTTIEERLYWINKSEKRRVEESEKLRNDILRDELYHLFRLFVGDPVTYQEQEGWDTAEKKRGEEIDDLINSINDTNLRDWLEKLNKIAIQHTIVEEWKFNPFKGFLRKLSQTKPQIADDILGKIFETSSPLQHFTGSFLDGFRTGTHFGIWDKHTKKIIDAEDVQLITAVVFSLSLPPESDLEKLVREEDIELLESITNRDGQFAFLKKVDDRVFQYALFNALARNFRRSPKKIEPLLVEEIKNYPKYLNMFFSELPMTTHRRWIDIKVLHLKTIEFLKEKMVELHNIDWHAQEILLAIGEQYGLEPILDMFMKRIRKDESRKEKERRRIDDTIRYEVIPYHFNPGLNTFITEHPEYIKIAGSWIAEMTTDWSVYNWHVSHFLQRIGKGFDDIIASLIQKGDDGSLLKAARAMHSIDGTNIDLCIEIVRRTDNKRIMSQIDSNMYSTGLVSGEYGLAEAYEGRAKTLEKYKTDESERVRKFAGRMIGSFLDSAKRERQRADEEKQLRKIEFEG